MKYTYSLLNISAYKHIVKLAYQRSQAWRKGAESRKAQTEQKCNNKMAKLGSNLRNIELRKSRNTSHRPNVCVLQNPIAALILTVMWRWDFWEVIRFKWGHEGGVLMMGLVSHRGRNARVCLLSAFWGGNKKVAIYNPGRRLSQGTESASTCIWTSASRTVWNKCPLFKAPCWWYFVIAAQAD